MRTASRSLRQPRIAGKSYYGECSACTTHAPHVDEIWPLEEALDSGELSRDHVTPKMFCVQAATSTAHVKSCSYIGYRFSGKMAVAESSRAIIRTPMPIKDLKRSKRRRAEQADRTSTTDKPAKPLADQLAWRPVNTSSFAGMDDGGGMMMFEELDGVDVAWDEDLAGRKVARFVVSDRSACTFAQIDKSLSRGWRARNGRARRGRSQHLQMRMSRLR